MRHPAATHGALAELLAAWLPAQRWFAGSAGQAAAVRITSDVLLAEGEPELRHLIAHVSVGGASVAYQVPLGIRSHLPDPLAAAAIGTLPDGRIGYDAAADPELTAVLLDAIAARRTAGPVRFAAVPDAVVEPGLAARTLPAATSNTSVVFGDRAILKLLRRPFAGHHPDLEIPATLAAAGSALVAPPLGWIELAAGDGGDAEHGGLPAVLGIASQFFPGATDGWSLALASLHADRPDFAPQARELGAATARLHAELAAAFGTRELTRSELAELADAMTAELADAVAFVPQLAAYQAGVAAWYARLAEPGPPVRVQRIHGDYHLAQVLRTGGGWVVLDFEGEPSVPIERRRAFAPALRDVAGMLRSFDYAARHQLLQRPGDARLEAVAAEWVDRCQRAFCAGYAEVSGADPAGSGPLLRALTCSKAVYEAVYEVRHRPDWLPIPLGALAEAAR
ncbi:MAG TPA: aminoglycoside phosphotransferase [Streptosporangiaceae bacterium]|nr:aminoglycoside phosphotransferase [Streptosporangiaceae bacterium]